MLVIPELGNICPKSSIQRIEAPRVTRYIVGSKAGEMGLPNLFGTE